MYMYANILYVRIWYITMITYSILSHGSPQSGWHGEAPALTVFGDGENAVPTIHVYDLARSVLCFYNLPMAPSEHLYM